MASTRSLLTAPPAIIRQVEDFPECVCPTCKRLDKRFPGQGVQLALFRYVMGLRRAG